MNTYIALQAQHF